ALHATPDRSAVLLHLGFRDGAIVLKVQVEAPDAEYPGQQELRIEPRLLDPAPGQHLRRLARQLQRPLHFYAADADSSCSASLASLSALISSSRSPFSTSCSRCSVSPIRWSVTRPCGKLYVRIFADRSPVPTCVLRAFARSASCSAIFASSSRLRSTFSALTLFLSCDFSPWQVTTTPAAMCVIRTADSVVLTDWPPGPLER